MAVVTVPSDVGPLDYSLLYISVFPSGKTTTSTATLMVVDFGARGIRNELTGVGLTYSASGELSGGTITGFRYYEGNVLTVSVEGVSLSAARLTALDKAGDTDAALNFVFGGDDQFVGTKSNDFFIGGPGNDTFNGAGGLDTVEYGAAATRYTLT